MTLTRPRLKVALVGAAIAMLLPVLAGCGSSAQPFSTIAAGGSETSAPPTSGPTPSATPTPTASAATCESIVVPVTLGDLTAKGWTAKKTPFTAGGITLKDGFQCTWADYRASSGPLLIFGWAPITSEEAAKMQSALQTAGWLREAGGDSVFITEDPTQALTTDSDGYGMTYEFGDGWVTVADVKQGLLLIQRP